MIIFFRNITPYEFSVSYLSIEKEEEKPLRDAFLALAKQLKSAHS
jgi:hypothetical protein